MTRITDLVLVFVVAIFTAALALAQTQSSEKTTTANLPLPQLEFVDREPYNANGDKGMRFKLRVTNRASLPEFLWQQSANLPPCGGNENVSRTWVEIFGSPGDKRLAGFCRLRSSEDLGQLWYTIPAGEKGPPCVYIVMTDRQTGQKYQSNRTCSRLLSLVTGTKKESGEATVKGGFGWDSIGTIGSGNAAQQPDSGAGAKKLNGTSVTSVTREQLAALILQGLGETKPPRPGSQRYADVPPESPFYAFIDRVAALRIIPACSRDKFCPTEPVAREQLAASIVSATGTSNPPPPAEQRFVDVPPTNIFYRFIGLVVSRKLMTGCGDNNFCPKEPVTRDEAAAALKKAFPSNSNSAGPKVGGQQQSPANIQGGAGKDRILSIGNGNTNRPPGSGVPTDKKADLAQPDLRIRQFLFPPTNDKALRVQVVNTGKAPSAACRLVLTVRKINGVAVGRTTYVNVPALAAGEADWLHIDVKSILPNNVSLQSTTFRLNIDATEVVGESNESNNEVWHTQ